MNKIFSSVVSFLGFTAAPTKAPRKASKALRVGRVARSGRIRAKNVAGTNVTGTTSTAPRKPRAKKAVTSAKFLVGSDGALVRLGRGRPPKGAKIVERNIDLNGFPLEA